MNDQVSKWELKNQDKPASSMTKREMIAMNFTNSLLSNSSVSKINITDIVSLADALLAELDKTK